MHEASIKSMQRCIDAHDPWPLARGKLRVLDVGSLDVNGSYRSLFDPDQCDYIGVDLEGGHGVDLVLESPYTLPFEDESFDLIVSGQMMEHNEFFWLTFQEMMRVLRPEGMCYLIAPSRGEIHRYPADCYRYYPDGFRALAKYTNTQMIACWLDTENAWGDLTAVYRKRNVPDEDQFDTTTIDTIGGPAAELMKVSMQLLLTKERLKEARRKLRELGVAES